MSTTTTIDLDFETRSRADIRKTSLWNYASDPSTQVLMMSWSINKSKTRIWYLGDPLPRRMFRLIGDPNGKFKLRAFNSWFEFLIWKFVCHPKLGWPEMPPSRFICAQAISSNFGLPPSLAGAEQALGLGTPKDSEGKRLIQLFSVPNRSGEFNEPKDDPEDFKLFGEYCITDTDVQIGIVKALPAITPLERKIFLFTQKVNIRGVFIDQALARKAIELYTTACDRLNARCHQLTKGKVDKASQRDVLRAYLNESGVPLADMQAKTIERLLKGDTLNAHQHELLTIREAVSKTSVAKYAAALARVSDDGRIHESLRYYGALKTGRWTSSGMQLHNLARPTLPKWTDYETVIELLKADDITTIEVIYGDLAEVLSSCIRSMIMAEPGNRLIVGDYAAIEARVLAWLSGCTTMSESFRRDECLYSEMASTIYDMPLAKIAKDSFERFIGKQAILGLGYQMGDERFIAETYKNSDVVIEPEFAKRVVKAYRTKYPEVPQLWNALNRAAIEALTRPGVRINANALVSFVKHGDHLHCILPNKGTLVYPFANLQPNKFRQMAIHYKSYAKGKWVTDSTYGGRFAENLCQRVARDIMANGLMAAEEAGYHTILSVHDEGGAEVKEDFGSIEEYGELLCAPTPGGWGDDIQLKAECYEAIRYRK